MDFILDTNVLVHFVRSNDHIRTIEERFSIFSPENSVFVSIVSIGEIKSLAFQFQWGKPKIDRMNYLLHAFTPFPVDNDEIASAYADLDAYSQGTHPLHALPAGMTARNMGKNDLWIASTAMLLSGTLLTTDADFAHLSPRFFASERVFF